MEQQEFQTKKLTVIKLLSASFFKNAGFSSKSFGLGFIDSIPELKTFIKNTDNDVVSNLNSIQKSISDKLTLYSPKREAFLEVFEKQKEMQKEIKEVEDRRPKIIYTLDLKINEAFAMLFGNKQLDKNSIRKIERMKKEIKEILEKM